MFLPESFLRNGLEIGHAAKHVGGNDVRAVCHPVDLLDQFFLYFRVLSQGVESEAKHMARLREKGH